MFSDTLGGELLGQGVVFLKPAEAAKLLRISERQLWSKSAPRGPVPCVKIGKSVRYRLSDLMKLGAVEVSDGQRE